MLADGRDVAGGPHGEEPDEPGAPGSIFYPQIALVSATRGEGVSARRVRAWWGRGARGPRQMRRPISARVWARCGAARGAGEHEPGPVAARVLGLEEIDEEIDEELRAGARARRGWAII